MQAQTHGGDKDVQVDVISTSQNIIPAQLTLNEDNWGINDCVFSL